METEIICWQHLVGPNDSNGNPRRVYVAYERDATGELEVCAVWDESYIGKPKELRRDSELHSACIFPKEYKQWLKHPKFQEG